MARVKSEWGMGLKAGDLVWHGERMAQVVAFVPDFVPPGKVPIIFLQRPEDEDYGVMAVPADDLDALIEPFIN